MLKKLRKKILNKLKTIVEKDEIDRLIKNYKDEEKIIYFQTPEHGNLGDQAIAIAGEKLIKDKYPNKLFLEFSFDEYNRNKNKIKELINDNDILHIHGGGNFGDLYLREEIQRRDIIQTFSNNKIISMPQSISYISGENINKNLEITKNIIKNHRKLSIISRDNKSYKFAKENFVTNNIVIAPDSVLYLEDYYADEISSKREGVIFTIRQDKEKILSKDKIQKIIKKLEEKKIKYNIDDTTVKYDVNKKMREYEVKRILKKISNSKLNITDRFHGVIFSVITRTPVIAFKSLDHKIVEGIKWFNHLDYIHYVNEDSDIDELLNKYLDNDILNKENGKYELKEKIKKIFFDL